MQAEARERVPLLPIVAGVGLVQFLWQLTLLWKGERFLTTLVAIDDTYYYLQTAWNLKTLGFVTFDGLHATNGVQFLWFAVLAGLSLLTESKSTFLLLSIGACAFFNTLCYLPMARIGAILHNRLLALLIAMLWTGQTFFVKRYLFAMENSLHALVFWCVVWQMVLFCRSVRAGKMRGLWPLTIVLILNAWTRLDSGLFSAVLYGYCLFLWYRMAVRGGETLSTFWREHRARILATGGFAGAAFGLQLLAFRWMGDSFLPVSALVKTGDARQWGWHLIETPVEYFVRGLPPGWLPEWPGWLLAALGAIALGVAGLRIHRTLPDEPATSAPQAIHVWRDVWTGLLLAFVLYHVVVWLSGARYEGYFTWYRSPLYIFWTLTAAYLLTEFFDGITGRMARMRWTVNGRESAPWVTWAGVLAIAITSTGMYVRSPLSDDEIPAHLYAVRYDIALWMRDNFPPGTIFAAWNAGQLGYFSEHHVVNLDGLINHVSYYEEVLHGDRPLEHYLQETGVAFVVDYEDNPLTRSLPLLHEFPSVDRRQMKIWQVPPPPAAQRTYKESEK